VIYLLEQCPSPCVLSYTKKILNTTPIDNQPPEKRGRKCLLVKATNHNFKDTFCEISLIFVLFGCLSRSLGPQVVTSNINNYVRHVVQFLQVAHRSWVLLDMLEWYCKHGQFSILWSSSYTCCTESCCVTNVILSPWLTPGAHPLGTSIRLKNSTLFNPTITAFFHSLFLATVNQHSPVHHEGWMVNGLETVFCWVPVP